MDVHPPAYTHQHMLRYHPFSCRPLPAMPTIHPVHSTKCNLVPMASNMLCKANTMLLAKSCQPDRTACVSSSHGHTHHTHFMLHLPHLHRYQGHTFLRCKASHLCKCCRVLTILCNLLLSGLLGLISQIRLFPCSPSVHVGLHINCHICNNTATPSAMYYYSTLQTPRVQGPLHQSSPPDLRLLASWYGKQPVGWPRRSGLDACNLCKAPANEQLRHHPNICSEHTITTSRHNLHHTLSIRKTRTCTLQICLRVLNMAANWVMTSCHCTSNVSPTTTLLEATSDMRM